LNIPGKLVSVSSQIYMKVRSLGIVAVGLVLVTSAVLARGRDSGVGQAKSPAPARSTLNGVYTTAQASAGEEVYFTFCVSCHPTPTYTGPAFKLHWQGRPLADLYEWVSEKMPKNEPGSLTPKQSVDAIAYILRLNKLPAGQTPIPTDYPALRRITIELK
jgi:hypothetical protein